MILGNARRPWVAFVIGLTVMAGLWLTASPAAARSAPAEFGVYFTRGEQLTTVIRRSQSPSVQRSLRALFAGPTRTELGAGIRSNIPAGTRLLSVTVGDRVATVDVSEHFAQGTAESLQARLAEVVFTATAFRGVRSVRVAVNGEPVAELGGLSLDSPLTRQSFAPRPAALRPAPAPPSTRSELVRSIQTRLVRLGYLPDGSVDGVAGNHTRHGIVAFQKWHGLPRDGRVTEQLKARLDRAARPVPGAGPSRRIEVYLERQVAILVHRGRALRTIHVSTGKPSTPTPPGRFQVFRKELRSWSVPFRVWLPYASYFNRGIAFHESPDVPSYAASAGCVRVSAYESRRVYEFATLGTPVIVRR